MDLSPYVTAFVTLFVVIDPIGLAPVFIALTPGMSAAQRRRIGFRALVIAAVLMMIFGLAGESILAAIGISISAFRIAGGLLLFLTALDMLFERRTQRREPEHALAEAVALAHALPGIEIVGDEVVVNGRVVGRVRGLKVRLTATARVEGDIIHKTIAIESGAHFEGSVQRQEDPLSNGKPAALAAPGAVDAV